MFSFLKKQQVSPEQQFWVWVVKNKIELEKFITSKPSDYSIYYQLTDEMKKYNSLLFPEITVSENNEIVLIITPDGMAKGVEPTQKLFAQKPIIDNWIVKKFRQAKDEINLNYDGVEYASSDIEIIPELDNEREKINIEIFIRNMNIDEKRYQSLAWLYLDHILGEFNTITKVGYIGFHHLDEDKSVKNSITILELRKLIEREIYKVNT